MPRAIKNGKNNRAKSTNVENVHFSSPRISILAFFIFAVAGIILIKLYFLQVLSYSSYRALADEQHSIFKKLVPKRGEIFLQDKNGLYPVALNRDIKMAYAVPKEIENAGETTDKISRILGLDFGETYAKLNQPEDMYEVLKHKLSDEEVQKINEAKINGIHLSDETFRYYPAGELASHVLGFVGWKDNELGGRYGLEKYLDDELRGREGNIFTTKDNSGRHITLGEKDIEYAKDGDSLVLTIDHIIQYESEKILKAAIEKYEAEKGALIVMEPDTGKILALASFPNFNPNDYASVENMDAFRNLAVSDAYEPGSIFKTFTMAAAVDAGKVSPDTTYVDAGAVTEAGYTIKNSDLKANGLETMTQVLEKSLNTGVIFAEKLLGNKNFSDYVQRFGFGTPTGVDMFGEASGNVNNLKNTRSNIQFFTASFGQGITTTPIQIASAYNVLASRGILYKPQIIDKIIHPDGTEEKIKPEEIRRVVSTETAYTMENMLTSVVVNGHGKRAGVPGYIVGGKTGTAQVASTTSKGYEEGKSIGSFAGFAPVDNPKYTVLIRMDDPKSVEWAESSAAPAFGELMKFLLDYGNVEPNQPYTQKDVDIWNATHTLKADFIKKNEEDKDGQNNKSEDNKKN